MNKTSIVALVAVPLLMLSCIKAEQANTECDIEAVSLHFESPTGIFYHEYDTMQTVISSETDIVFIVRSYANVHSVPLTLRVTEGASIFLSRTVLKLTSPMKEFAASMSFRKTRLGAATIVLRLSTIRPAKVI